MNKKEYTDFIIKKYKCPNELLQQYIVIDSLISLSNIVTSEKTVNFKGALNLYMNHGYKREKMTKDADFSIFNIELEKFVKKILAKIKSDTNSIYRFKNIGKKPLIIMTNGYNGFKLTIEAIINKEVVSKISCDIAVEELYNDEGIVYIGKIRSYTIERTLADKYLALISHGRRNTRIKDVIDLKELFPKCNKELFKKLVLLLYKPKKITKKDITRFASKYKEYKVIKENGAIELVKEIIKILE